MPELGDLKIRISIRKDLAEMAVLYVGSYTQGIDGALTGSEGIYAFHLNEGTGVVSLLQTVKNVTNPSFLAYHNGHLYACEELPDKAMVVAYKRNSNGTIEELNRKEARGAAACHISVHPFKSLAIVSNYVSGNILSFSLREDGGIGALCDDRQHTGHGTDAVRQEQQHTHSATVEPCGRYAAVADLGQDRVFLYDFDAEGRFRLCGNPIVVPDGEGPRHIAFSSDSAHAYLVTEMGNHVLHYTCRNMEWELVQTLPILPEDFERTPLVLAADIHVSPDEKFVYASNRGWNGITAYHRNADGQLSLCGRYQCGGEWPRNFCISPDGAWIVVANQNSGTMTLLPRNCETGELRASVREVQVPQAVCVLWTEN